MIPLRSRFVFIVIGFVVLVGVGAAIYLFQIENHPVEVNELWHFNPRNSLNGKTRTVRGDIIFDPVSDFQFNALYLVDTESSLEYRAPEYGFWFGIRMDGAWCNIDKEKEMVNCKPFNPTLATTYEFKGTINIDAVGKKNIMWLSDIDFAKSRQMINGKWQPIPLGDYTFPMEKP